MPLKSELGSLTRKFVHGLYIA